MGTVRALVIMMAVTATAVGAVAEEPGTLPEQDPVLLRLVERALPYYPDSVFRVTEDVRERTPSGSYRRVTVERESMSKFLSGSTTLYVDEMAEVVWIGPAGQLPLEGARMGAGGLKGFLEGFLPDALGQSMGLKLRVDWDPGDTPSGALIPFTLRIDSGYGEYPKPAAVTSDGGILILGVAYPLNADPVEWRRELLRSSGLVMWDPGPTDGAIDVVEFSDLECPACRGKWPMLKDELKNHKAKLRHGMVSFPITTIHPWSFRGASAMWCVAEQEPSALTAFKEQFYSMQGIMEVSQVTPTAVDFVAGAGLDEEAFRACYLKRPSLDAVHGQIALAHRLGVNSTPTYFFDGWMVQVPDALWFPDFVASLVATGTP
jgi:protein-disulfide isomerase